MVDLDEQRLVEESLHYLLERDNAAEIPAEVRLEELRRDYPDYLPTMRDLLGGVG